MRMRALLSNARNLPASNRWRGGVQRVGLPLALFAIVLQLALLFGHHHFGLSDGGGSGNVPVISAMSETGQATSTSDESQQGQIPSVPAQTPCLLCLAIHAAASIAAAAPPLMLPVAYERMPVAYPAVASIMPPLRVSAFDSRGPPRA